MGVNVAGVVTMIFATLIGVIFWQGSRLEAMRDDAAILRRETAALRAEAEQAKLARDVAKANADRVEARAAEYDALRQGVLKGGDDAPIAAVVADTLVRLRSR